ncbi:MAG: Mut7-C RNAse domain-containing protein, partial [Pseudomonadota bacterium]
LLKGGETVLVLPQLAAHWREQPALNALDTLPPAFVADVNLGRLARLLRLLGFDTLYRNDYDDAAVAAAATNGRVILTRDRRLLMRRQIDFGCFVHADRPRLQAREVLNRFKLHALVQPFSRCSHCNGQVRRADKQAVLDQLQPKTRRYYQRFWQCTRCGQVYWEGSHLQGLRDLLSELKAA